MTMEPMDVTGDERELLLRRRHEAERKRWVCEGMERAALHLDDLAEQSGGGDGATINPATGMTWGHAYTNAAKQVRDHAKRYLAERPDPA